MAPTRKSAKRAGKKRSGAKRTSAKKRPSRKAASRRSTKTAKRARKTSPLKKRAEQGLRAARGGLDTVREAGERTWEVLKSTTSQMVEGVKDRLGDDSNGEGEYRRDRFAR